MSLFIQILLVAVVLVLTVLVAIAAIQVFHILTEFRQALQKVNSILNNTQTLSESSAKPIAAVNEFFTDVKALVNETQDEIVDSIPDRVLPPHAHSHPSATTSSGRTSPKRHFFRRSGLPLRPS